jgi:hypothetical protein
VLYSYTILCHAQFPSHEIPTRSIALSIYRSRALPHLHFAPAWPRRSESMGPLLERRYGVTLRAERFMQPRVGWLKRTRQSDSPSRDIEQPILGASWKTCDRWLLSNLSTGRGVGRCPTGDRECSCLYGVEVAGQVHDPSGRDLTGLQRRVGIGRDRRIKEITAATRSVVTSPE